MLGTMRRGAVLATALATCAALLASDGARSLIADECDPTQRLDCLPPEESIDTQWAIALEQRIADNMWGGQVYDIDYFTSEQVLGQVAGVGGFGDSALWTGTYLGAESFRYATAQRRLKDFPPRHLGFWKEQKAQALERIYAMVEKFNVLINISKYWNHELHLNPQQAGFGGGVINGEAGYLMRACIDEDTIDMNPTGKSPEPDGAREDPTKPDFYGWSSGELDPESRDLPPPYTSNRRVFGPFTWDDGTVYYCEDGTSRDAYAGTIFGLLVAFDLLGDDVRHLPLRRQIRDDIVTLSNFALKYLWTTPRPHGQISIPFDSDHESDECEQINTLLDVCGHDFENFWSPLFSYTPTAQMELAQAARHVTANLLGHADTLKWELAYTAELAATAPFLSLSHLVDTAAPYDSYYKWNLEHLIAYNLIRQAPNPVARTLFRDATAVMDATTGDDVNAHFESIIYAVSGDKPRLSEAISYLREWPKYRTFIDSGADGDIIRDSEGKLDGIPDVDNLRHCGMRDRWDCVPEDQLDVEPVRGEGRYVIPGTSGKLRAHVPQSMDRRLPIDRRTPTDFLWQRAPNQLRGSEEIRHQAPGIDYLLPYWMIRYLTEVSAPSNAPLDPWLGPSFH